MNLLNGFKINHKVKVFDMRISGIWMAQEQRSTFTSFLSKNNGDINKLINRLNSESR